MTRPLALVTGASSGIGLELARQFVDNGFDVVITAEDDLTAAQSSLSAGGAKVWAVQADLSTYEGVERVWSAVPDVGLDTLALNAGVGVNGDFTRDIPLEDDLRLIALNVTSAVHLAKRALPGMVTRGRGRVLVTSSVAGLMPGPYYATYAASKAFLQSFAQAIRHELKDTGVTVTALQPGPTDTEFFDRAGMQDTAAGSGPKDDPADVARQGFEALMAGKDHVVAGGLKNQAQAAGTRLMPETAQAASHAALTKPRSEDDNG
jgi:short-subunit dehydrogenase